jgi:Protein of unknown function (DUF4043)
MAVGDAGFTVDLTDAYNINRWEKEVLHQVVQRATLINDYYGLIGDKPQYMIQRRKKVFSDPEGGTKARVTLIRNFRRRPGRGAETERGQEEGLSPATFDWEINQLRHSAALNNQRVSQNRVPWNIWDEMMYQMSVYWPTIYESGLFMHLCGITADLRTEREWYHDGTDLAFTLNNTPVAPDAKHVYRFGHADDSEVNGDPGAVVDIDTGSKLVAMAQSMPIPIRPATTPWGDLYVFFLHTYSAVYLRSTASAWWNAMTACLKGGAIEGNPVFTGALGILDGVLYAQANYIPPGFVGSTPYRNVRRNVFCGAQSAVMGFGKDYEDQNTFTTETDKWDYANNRGICNACMVGAASPYFSLPEQGTTEDFGKIVVPSYAEELVVSA